MSRERKLSSLISRSCRFLLAKFQLDHILQSKESRERLKAINTAPRDINSAYYDVMKRIQQSDQGDMKLILKVLSWIYRARRLLSIDELQECLVMTDDDTALERELMICANDIIDSCKSFIIYDESSGLIQFVYYTLQEFITSEIENDLLSDVDIA